MPVAIIGIGCRFPGGVIDAAGFWRLLTAGVDAITGIPRDRFDIGAYYDERPATPGKIMSRFGGFIDQRFDEFDAPFFGISRTYAERLDPQQRLLLETSWEALEDAGLDVVALQGSRTGVFVGQWLSEFEHRLFADHSRIDFPMTLGSGRYAVPGRLSYAFGFRGPSLSLDAGCSAGLAAVHLAVRSLRSGESTMALAGGVNVILQPHIHVAYSQSRMMAADGHCKFGDAKGDGYVRSEGVGVVVLKPLDRALADGDRVYAVIRGSAVNNDGDSSGSMGTPSRTGQEELLRTALQDAQVAPASVGYVEAHGTGTRAGDPVELGALSAVLSDGRASGSRVVVGSVKTNLGHTEATAGVAGLIKGALMLHHGMIPPSLNFREPNPAIDWTRVTIPTALTAWPATSSTRVAGVSSFGIGGTNAHVVLESLAQPAVPTATPSPGTPALLPLSARSDAALRALAGRYADLLVDATDDAVADVCWSAASRRTALTHRAAFVAQDRGELVASLRAFAAGDTATAVGVVHDTARRRVAFVVPGQGAQWVGMARQFMAQVPVFRAALESCDAAAHACGAHFSIIGQLHLDAGAPGYLGDRIDVIQPTLIALAIAYAAWLRDVGVEPDAVVGHSLGEVGAAAIAGVLDVASAMRVICSRSALMQRTSGQGAMAVVELSAADATLRLRGFESRVSVAVNNGPRSTVISGDPAAVTEILDGLQRDGVFCRLVKVDVASHSPQMAPLVHDLISSLGDLRPSHGTVPIYSTVRGALLDGAAFTADYWGQNLRQPVQFGDTVQRMLTDGMTAFIELGPHPVLTQAVQQVAQATQQEAVSVACGRRETGDLPTAFGVIATIWASGGAVDWRRVMPWHARTVALPLYPWQRERYWAESAELAPSGLASQRRHHPTAAIRSMLHTLVWRRVSAQSHVDALPSNWIVVADDEVSDGHRIAETLARSLGTVHCVASVAEATVILAEEPDRRAETGLIVISSGAGTSLSYTPVSTLNALVMASGASAHRPARVWWVTRAAQVVTSDASETAEPYAAALWGAARVVAEEHPEWWGGLIDVAANARGSALAQAIARALAVGGGEDQLAVREDATFALRIVPIGDESPTPFAWRADAAYLITGGFGGVGMKLAVQMVKEGVRRLVLVSRTPLPPRVEWASLPLRSAAASRVAAVRSLEHLGASVHVLCADVADVAAMRAILSHYRAEGWPDIDGVVHAAGILDNHLCGAMTDEAFAGVMSAKVAGAEVLDALFPDVSQFILCSSIMAFWGATGMSNYAAANAGCDAIALRRRAAGHAATSIEWCVWKDTGMVDDPQMSRNVAAMAQLGLRAIDETESMACFDAILSRRDAVVSVLPLEWQVFSRVRRGRLPALYREIPEAVADAAATDGWLHRIAKTSIAERKPLLEALVRGVVSDILRRPAVQIPARGSFGSLGVDSLMALEIRNRLEAAVERPLSATLAWNYPTVEALAAHLGELLTPADARARPIVSSSVVAAASDATGIFEAVESLSDAEALRALRGGR